MTAIVFLWISLILIGTKYNKNINDIAFTMNNSIALRGICSIEIMMGHLGIATGSLALFPNRKAGILFVGIFFALSGYGLMYCIKNKEGYLKNFFKNRLGKLLLPAYFIFVIGIVLQSVISKNGSNMICVFDVKLFFIATNWYVWELLILYTVFFISLKVDRKMERFHIWILIFSILFIGFAHAMNFERPWYGSTLCFWGGIIYFLYQNKFKETFVIKHPAINLISCCFVMVLALGMFFYLGGVMGVLISRNVAAMSFVMVVITLLYRFNIGNKASIWLGKYSYEIFLFHPIFINLFRRKIENNVTYSLAVIGTTVLASYIFKTCEKWLKHVIEKM